jgi:methyl-accepting chemotaxis protein
MTLFRLALRDSTGFDFLTAVVDSDKSEYALLVILYFIMASVILLGGITGAVSFLTSGFFQYKPSTLRYRRSKLKQQRFELIQKAQFNDAKSKMNSLLNHVQNSLEAKSQMSKLAEALEDDIYELVNDSADTIEESFLKFNKKVNNAKQLSAMSSLLGDTSKTVNTINKPAQHTVPINSGREIPESVNTKTDIASMIAGGAALMGKLK